MYNKDVLFQIWCTRIYIQRSLRKKQVTRILTININKIVLSDRVPCNNGKDWWYIVDYQVCRNDHIIVYQDTKEHI